MNEYQEPSRAQIKADAFRDQIFLDLMKVIVSDTDVLATMARQTELASSYEVEALLAEGRAATVLADQRCRDAATVRAVAVRLAAEALQAEIDLEDMEEYESHLCDCATIGR